MDFGCRRLAILSLATVITCAAQQLSDFEGRWLLKVDGQAIAELTISNQDGRITGLLTAPKRIDFNQEGQIASITPEQVKHPIQEASFNAGRLDLTIDGDHHILTIQDKDHAVWTVVGMPVLPWHLERSADPSFSPLT